MLSFELDGCIDASAGMQLADYLDDPSDVEGLTCSFTEGVGNGVMPDPVTLTGCEVSGTPEVYYSHRSWMPGPDHLDLYEGETIPEPATLFDDYATRGSPARRSSGRVKNTSVVTAKYSAGLVAP